MKKVKSLILPVLFLGFFPVLVQAATVEVLVVNFDFQPQTVTIDQGDTVRWVFQQGTHTSTSGTGCNPDGIWNSGTNTSGQTFEFTFTQAGNYPYYCIPHCSLGMTGTVIVNQASTSKIEFTVDPGCGNPGNSVTIFGESTFGGELYRFFVKPPNQGYQLIQDWSSNHTANWVPAESGAHIVVVHVNDTPTSSCVLRQMGGTYGVGSSPCIYPVQVKLTPANGTVNEPVEIKAEAPGIDLLYKFWVRDADFCASSQRPPFTPLTEFTSADTYTFIPSAPGVYTLIAHVKANINDSNFGQGGVVYIVPSSLNVATLYAENFIAETGRSSDLQ